MAINSLEEGEGEGPGFEHAGSGGPNQATKPRGRHEVKKSNRAVNPGSERQRLVQVKVKDDAHSPFTAAPLNSEHP